jgi:hypothetical protein
MKKWFPQWKKGEIEAFGLAVQVKLKPARKTPQFKENEFLSLL